MIDLFIIERLKQIAMEFSILLARIFIGMILRPLDLE
jgi:hypothetical protein